MIEFHRNLTNCETLNAACFVRFLVCNACCVGDVLPVRIQTIFWSDWGQNPRIESAALDGNDRTTILNVDLEAPAFLTLDLPTKRLYFVDVKTHHFAFCEYNGTDRHTIFVSDKVKTLLQLPRSSLQQQLQLYCN